MKGDGTSLVEVQGGKPKVRGPRARLADARNGVAPGVLVLDLDDAGEEQPAERDERGRFTAGCKAGPQKGAAAKHRASKLARDLGLATMAQLPGFAPYLRDAKNLARAALAYLAQYGGGQVGTVVGVIVQGAALQTAASRYLFAKGDFAGGSRLQNDARSSLVYARHIAGQDAVARKRGQPLPALDAATDAEIDAEVTRLIAQNKTSSSARESGSLPGHDDNDQDGEETES